MLRAAVPLLACLLLGACSGWVSDERLFGDSDWAHLNINGRYKSTVSGDESDDRMILKSRPDGLIEGHSTDRHDKSRTLIGLVPIRGGSGDYFLSVDRSNDDEKGDEYFIVRVSDGKTLEYFIPDCDATPQVEGMTKVHDDRGFKQEAEGLDDDASGATRAASPAATATAAPQPEPQSPSDDKLVCKFATKDALMAAGLEAEKFLSAKHIVELTPFLGLAPDDGTEQPTAEKRTTRRPPLRRSRR